MKESPKFLARLHRQAGVAIYLLELLIACTNEWDGSRRVLAAGGVFVSDKWLSSELGVTARTLTAWRKKLYGAGVLEWACRGRKGRIYVLIPETEQLISCEKSSRTVETKQEARAETRRPETEPLASRFVQ